MSKYAFLIAGEQGEYENINSRLRLRKYGSWLVAEKIAQEKLAKRQNAAILAALQLSKRVATDKGIELQEAFGLLQDQSNPESAVLFTDYLEEVQEVINQTVSPEESDRQLIGVFLRLRGEGNFDGEWRTLSDWSDEDTESLTEGLIEKIRSFILQEQGLVPSDEEEVEEEKTKA